MADVRKIVKKALVRVEDGGFSNLVWDNALATSDLDNRDSAFGSALFYGVLERKLTLDFVIGKFSKLPPSKISPEVRTVLRMGIYQMLFMDKVPESAAVDQSVRLIKNSRESKASGFVNALLRSVARAGENVLDYSKLKSDEKLSFQYSVPKELVSHLINNYGIENTIGILSNSFGRPALNIRVNTLKTTAKDLKDALCKQGATVEDSLICKDYLEISGLGSIEKCKEFNDGYFHVQDTASGLCCESLNPLKGERVLDLCAAPGGKSFTMAEMMQNEGELYSLDLYDHKIKLINDGASRLGIDIIKAQINDAEKNNKELGTFNKVLFDLPCSGLGIIRRKPEIRYKNVANLDIFPDLQYSILCQNVDRMESGAVAVYSTCTLNPFENQKTVERFLNEHKSFEPYPILPHLERVMGESENMITLMPHIHKTDGFFISAFRKK